jgi:hypothetical protein
VPDPVHLPVRFEVVGGVVLVGEVGFGAALVPQPARETTSAAANSGARVFTAVEYNLGWRWAGPR